MPRIRGCCFSSLRVMWHPAGVGEDASFLLKEMLSRKQLDSRDKNRALYNTSAAGFLAALFAFVFVSWRAGFALFPWKKQTEVDLFPAMVSHSSLELQRALRDTFRHVPRQDRKRTSGSGAPWQPGSVAVLWKTGYDLQYGDGGSVWEAPPPPERSPLSTGRPSSSSLR